MKYFVSIPKNDRQFLSGKNIKNIQLKEDTIEFETNEKSIQRLQNEISSIYLKNQRKEKIKKILKKYSIAFIFFLITLFLLMNQSFTIQSITFRLEDTYDEKVLSHIYQYTKKIGPFLYLNSSIQTINDSLRNEFYDYEWIGIEKKGSRIIINIKKQDEHSFLDEESLVPGELVAKKDGVIRLYFVKKGIVLIKEGQSVFAGDILVTGNVKHQIGGIEYIHPVGVVIADILEYQNVQVRKKLTTIKRTGKIKTEEFYSFFNHSKKISSPFESFDIEEKIVLNTKIFKKIKRIYYEKKEITSTYTFDEAMVYAQSLIHKDFSSHQIHEKEELIYMNLIQYLEDRDYYYFKYIVKKRENIATFQAMKPIENSNDEENN